MNVHSLATSVELSVRCENLRDEDVFSKSDPTCVLFTKDGKTNKWLEVDRDEQLWKYDYSTKELLNKKQGYDWQYGFEKWDVENVATEGFIKLFPEGKSCVKSFT